MGKAIKFATQIDEKVLKDLKSFANQSDRTISSVVTEAVAEFIHRAKVRKDKGEKWMMGGDGDETTEENVGMGMENMDMEDMNMENMDMEKMLSHVTQNVFKMMNGNSETQAPEGLTDFMDKFNLSKCNFESESCILPKTRDIRFDLNVDLSDFYNGKTKKLNIKRKRIIEVDGKQKVVEEKKRIIIPIEKGMKDEQQIRFKGEADQIPGFIPGDIIVTLIENEHSDFQRDGDNFTCNNTCLELILLYISF